MSHEIPGTLEEPEGSKTPKPILLKSIYERGDVRSQGNSVNFLDSLKHSFYPWSSAVARAEHHELKTAILAVHIFKISCVKKYTSWSEEPSTEYGKDFLFSYSHWPNFG